MLTVHINPDDPKSIEAALNTEWLLTNGLGGYAMGTVLGVNTRRYHGLLVAATRPPVGRIVALHSMIEQLIIPREDGTEDVIDLSTQQFVGGDGEPTLHPNGFQKLVWCEVDNCSVHFEMRSGDFRIKKQLFLYPRMNRVWLTYLIMPTRQSVRLRIRPIVSLRDFHSLQTRDFLFKNTSNKQGFEVERDNSILSLTSFEKIGDEQPLIWRDNLQWWNRFGYVRDRERGQSWSEDLWSPGYFESPLSKEAGCHFTIKSQCLGPVELNQFDSNESVKRLRRDSHKSDMPRDRLVLSSTDFVVLRGLEKRWSTSVIAGYPWFGDWGRDTMIALPGLMLCTGRFDEARSTLLTFARSMKNGLLPNLFDDYGAAEHYNTVDASLWFVHAVHALWESQSAQSRDPQGATRSKQLRVRTTLPHGRGSDGGIVDSELLHACREIIAAYRRGTDFNIRTDERDCLIMAGDPSSQLTWMDAKRDNIAFTPRNGKPVEINALWFNALRCLAEMSNDSGERDELVSLSEKVAKSFREQYWWEERKCLHDVLSPRETASVQPEFFGDRRLRPNQIFAVSLPHSPLTREQQRAVVNIVRERLLTPFGLRTLDRDDPQYRPRYEGNLFERDSAYHQGTVWPWLIGPYCEAVLRVNDFSAKAKDEVRGVIQPLIDEMSNTSGGRCLNQIAEVYDGDPPHRPSGCPAQAWSVAEALRIHTLLEDEPPTV